MTTWNPPDPTDRINEEDYGVMETVIDDLVDLKPNVEFILFTDWESARDYVLKNGGEITVHTASNHTQYFVEP